MVQALQIQQTLLLCCHYTISHVYHTETVTLCYVTPITPISPITLVCHDRVPSACKCTLTPMYACTTETKVYAVRSALFVATPGYGLSPSASFHSGKKNGGS